MAGEATSGGVEEIAKGDVSVAVAKAEFFGLTEMRGGSAMS
jgi:hypothetical protein